MRHPTTRTFVLKSPSHRSTLECTLGRLVPRVEERIRTEVPATSRLVWEGSVLEGFWGVTALDEHHVPLCEFDLFETGRRS